MKKFARGLASTLLKLSLYGAAITASFAAVFASPDTLKSSLATNNLYDGLVQNVLEAATKNNETGESGAPADKQRSLDVLEAAATQAFTPAVLQNAAEQAIDGVYRWLNGEVEAPDFQIDLSQAKASFIAAAGAEVEKYVASLPVCTAEQMRQIDPDADPFSLTCRPANLTAAAIRDKSVNELTNNDQFIPNPVITADNLPKNENGKNFFEQAEGARNAYQITRALPWALLIISALLGLAVFFLSETKRKGIKSLAVSFFGTGVFLFLTTWLFGFLFDRAAQPGGMLSNSNNEFSDSILALVRSLNSIFNRTVLVYCLVYIGLGATTLLALRFTRPKLAAEPIASSDKETPEAEKSEAPKDPESKKTA